MEAAYERDKSNEGISFSKTTSRTGFLFQPKIRKITNSEDERISVIEKFVQKVENNECIKYTDPSINKDATFDQILKYVALIKQEIELTVICILYNTLFFRSETKKKRRSLKRKCK